MYNKKLELLKEELKITMVHAEEIINEYIETAAKQAVENYINQLDETEQMLLVFSLLSEMESQTFDELVNDIKQEKEPEKHNDDDDYVRSLIEYYKLRRD